MTTITTLFSGGELVGVGARAAGLTHLTGIEYQDDIANVARANGFDIITADVMTIDPHTLQVPDVLHASPVCKRASGANQSAELNEDGTKEAPEDIAAGEKIAQFIDVMRPKYFTLENVYNYRTFEAFKIVLAALDRNGYSFDYWHLNAADYGVPQSRQRLILIAKMGKGQRIQKPVPTHHDPKDYNPAQLSMFEPVTQPWNSWYSAIEDLIPTLPESQFAPWQLARLPEGLQTFAIGSAISAPISIGAEPIDTITLDNGSRYRAFILAQGKYPNGLVMADEAELTFTVTANSNQTGIRAWLIGSENAGQEWGGTKWDNQPAMTITQKQKPRAWLSAGRVVRMTARALARFQSVPDSYVLPASDKLACTVIGNGVPCKLYEAIARGLTE